MGEFRHRDLHTLLSHHRKIQPNNAGAPPRLAESCGCYARWADSQKSPAPHRYDVSPNGRRILTAILLAHRVTIQHITAAAA